MDKSWLEPPEWWKRYKPLRWILAFAVLLFAYAKFDDWRDSRAGLTTVAEQPAPPAEITAGREAPASPPPAAPKPAPAPPAKPAVAATPPPAPVDPMARYTQVESKRVNLMTLPSYQNLAAVSADLQKAGYNGELYTQKRKPRSGYPPHRLDTLEFAEYKHLGSAGKLKLEFFNDRLYEAYFEPVKAGDYLYKLRKQQKLKRDSRGQVEHVQGNLRISSNIDLAESEVGKALRVKPYILWQDLRLTRQIKEWGPVP